MSLQTLEYNRNFLICLTSILEKMASDEAGILKLGHSRLSLSQGIDLICLV